MISGVREKVLPGAEIKSGISEYILMFSGMNSGIKEAVVTSLIMYSGVSESAQMVNFSIGANGVIGYPVDIPELPPNRTGIELLFPLAQQPVQANTDGREWMIYCAPIVIPTIIIDGDASFSQCLLNLQIKKQLGAKTTLNFKMQDVNSDTVDSYNSLLAKLQSSKLNPIFGGFGSSTNILQRHRFNTDHTIKVILRVGYDQTGFNDWQSPYFVPIEPHFDGDTLDWGGEDVAAVLEEYIVSDPARTPANKRFKNIDLDDKKQEHSVQRSAVSAITEMVSPYKLNASVRHRDFQIRNLRRETGRVIDWVNAIEDIYKAHRSTNGFTLIFKPINSSRNNWTFMEGLHIEEGTLETWQDLSGHYNAVLIDRTSPNNGIIGEQECIGHECVGRTVNIKFSFPVTVANGYTDVTNGVLEDFVYENGGNPVGSYIGGGAGRYYIGSAVDGVKATYRASVGAASLGSNALSGGSADFGNSQGQVGYTPRYKVVFTGSSSEEDADTTKPFIFYKDNPEDIAAFGLYREDNIDNQIIPNSGVGLDAVNAALTEGLRKVWWIKFRTRYINPQVEPGDVIQVYDFAMNLAGQTWIIEDVDININGGDDYMEISACRGIQNQ